MKKFWIFILILISISLVQGQDSLSPSQGTDVNVTVDGDFPLITILNPQAITYSNFTPLLINFTIFDHTLDKIWYSLDNGLTNTTILGLFNLELAEGDYTIIIYANDSFSRTNSSQVDFSINNSIPVCGNAICDASESCSSCSVDCGSCSTPPNGGGGGGGGGLFCSPLWNCLPWSDEERKCGTRICEDIFNCGDDSTKPEEILECPLRGVAPQEPYCGDNICNAEENEITCESDCLIKPPIKTIILLIILIIITLFIIIYLREKNQKKKKKEEKRSL